VRILYISALRDNSITSRFKLEKSIGCLTQSICTNCYTNFLLNFHRSLSSTFVDWNYFIIYHNGRRIINLWDCFFFFVVLFTLWWSSWITLSRVAWRQCDSELCERLYVIIKVKDISAVKCCTGVIRLVVKRGTAGWACEKRPDHPPVIFVLWERSEHSRPRLSSSKYEDYVLSLRPFVGIDCEQKWISPACFCYYCSSRVQGMFAQWIKHFAALIKWNKIRDVITNAFFTNVDWCKSIRILRQAV